MAVLHELLCAPRGYQQLNEAEEAAAAEAAEEAASLPLPTDPAAMRRAFSSVAASTAGSTFFGGIPSDDEAGAPMVCGFVAQKAFRKLA